MKTNIQIIREAVIKMLDPKWIDGENAPNREVYMILAEGDDVTLAHVLRAIGSDNQPISIDTNGILSSFKASESSKGLLCDKQAEWNLSLPLDGQSPETLKFLADVLK